LQGQFLHEFFRYLPQTLAKSLRAVPVEASNMTRLSLNELHQRYVIERRPLEASLEEVLRADSRAGARAILASISKRRFENRSEGQRLRKMLRFETLLWEKGHDAVAGIDEAGMSPLAGPVSAAAVILKPGTRIIGIDDSKKLDPSARGARRRNQAKGGGLVCRLRRSRGNRLDKYLLGGTSRDATGS
jgi:hypothetical protein